MAHDFCGEQVWFEPISHPGVRTIEGQLFVRCVEGWGIGYCYLGDDPLAGPDNPRRPVCSFIVTDKQMPHEKS